MESTNITIRLTKKEKQAIKKNAAKQRRTMTSYILWMHSEQVKREKKGGK